MDDWLATEPLPFLLRWNLLKGVPAALNEARSLTLMETVVSMILR
mgnify:CR=1 FL=1